MEPSGTPERGRLSDEELARLLDPSFREDLAPHEPSAAERARIADRTARQANLARRLDEEASLAAAEMISGDVEHRHRRWRKRRRRLVVGAAIVALLGLVVWLGPDSFGIGGRTFSSHARPANYPPVDGTASSSPLGDPPPAPSNPGRHEFELLQRVGTGPVAWDPCREVRYVVNPEGEPPGGGVLLREAIARASAATGLRFLDDGTTTETWSKRRQAYQPGRYGKRWAPALITWVNESEVPDVAGPTAGLGGGIAQTAADGRMAYVSGQVALDRDDLARILTEPAGRDGARAVIQHELGHMLGLGHVDDATQIMFPESSPSSADDWGTGDLAGLHQLGSGPCIPEL